MRERTGVGQPCYGRIPASMVYDSPATVDSSGYGGIGIECEVAVKLGADLPASGAPYTRDSIAEYIEWLAAAFELGGQAGSTIARWADAGDLQHRHQHQQRRRAPRRAG